jgi:hypothetical protein
MNVYNFGRVIRADDAEDLYENKGKKRMIRGIHPDT